MSAADIASAQAALSAARTPVARLNETRGGEDNAADLLDAWDATQQALRALGSVDGLEGHPLIREVRRRGFLTLDQAHALVEFSAAADRARDTSYVPTRTDLAAARTGVQQLDVTLSAGPPAPATPTPAVEPPQPRYDPVPGPSPLRPSRRGAAVLVAGLMLLIIVATGGYYGWRMMFSPAASVAKGASAYAAGDRTTALRELESAVQKDDRLAGAHVYLGRIYRENGDFDRAARSLRRAIELDPALAIAQREMGSYLLAIGSYPLAAKFYIRAIELDPADRNATGFLGCALARQGRVDEANRFLSRAGAGPWSECAARQMPPLVSPQPR